jgi:DNA integrity scanning protein DisA with diadenylate cyclase activity
MTKEDQSSEFARQAFITALSLDVETIIVQTDMAQDAQIVNSVRSREKIIWLTTQRLADKLDLNAADKTLTLELDSIRGSAVRSMGILFACLRGIITPEEKVLCLYSSIAGKGLDSITITRPKDRLRIISKLDMDFIGTIFAPEVFTRLIYILTRFAKEGREGKPIGTIFVLAEPKDVEPYLKEMILNPCQGHPSQLRNVFNSSFFETFREFSALDGAFVVNRQGIVESAGVYLAAPKKPVNIRPGLGARHSSAAALTGQVECITMVLSESSGNITIFHAGEALFEIEIHHDREWRFS